jgi:EmrB/QacA subfamily drug resistance transporter
MNGRRWWALGALVLCILTFGFDATILNVALPTLATAIHADTSGLQWIVDAYVLVFAGLLLPAGVLGDRIGRRRLLLIGLGLFALASVGAAYVGNAGELVAARAVMGLGAAVIVPVTMAMLPVLFGPSERARAIAIATMGMGIGVPLGPIIGGWLLDHYWWGSVFLVNVPVAVVGAIAVAAFVPESRDPAPRKVDIPGGVLSTAGLIGVVYGVIEAPNRGWGSTVVLSCIAAGLLLLAGFVAWERRTPYPMIDLGLFGRRRFLWGTTAATIANFGLYGLLFVVPLYLQVVCGHDAFATGVRLLPLMAGLIVGAPTAERLAARIGSRVPMVTGLLLIAAGLLVGATSSTTDPFVRTAVWLAVIGAGVGMALAPAMDAVIGELPAERAGSGTALTMTLRQVGGAFGVALLGSLLSAAYVDRLDVAGLPAPAAAAARDSVAAAAAVARQLGDGALLLNAREAYTYGMSVVLLACAALAVLGAVLVALRMPPRPAVPSDAVPLDEEESRYADRTRAT